MPKNTYQPSPTALQWVAEAIGPDTNIASVRHMPGATSSVLHEIEAIHDGQRVKLVLRLFTNMEWLQEEPDIAFHEASSLQKAREAGVSAPELLACDEDGSRCGVPAILMTGLPGAVDLNPVDPDDWLYQMAKALIPIHAADVGTFPWRYRPYNDISRLQPPRWSSVPQLWARAIEIVQGPRPKTRDCFIHRDYHPTNILWQDRRVSGIVDWPNACRGAAGIDLGWCRMNLAPLYGVTAADRFLAAYQSLAGSAFEYHPYWDLITAIETLPGPPRIYPPWIEFGAPHLSDELVRERVDQYLASVIACT